MPDGCRAARQRGPGEPAVSLVAAKIGQQHLASPERPVLAEPEPVVGHPDEAGGHRVLGGAGASLALAYVRHSHEVESGRERLAEGEAKALLEQGAAALGQPDVPRHVVLSGSTPEGLRGLALAEHADLIVFGSEYRTAAGHVDPQASARRLLDDARDTMAELLGMDEPRKRIAAMLSGLDVHYDLGEGHPLLGRRMPDLDLDTADGPTRVFTLLHDARPLLLNLGEPGGIEISSWANRVRLVDAKHYGTWELPVLGEIASPQAVLIRPDGHVAWAGDITDQELPQALATWFGAAKPSH